MSELPDTSLFEKILWVYGPMAGILLYMLWRDYTDRKEIKKELADNKKLINNVMGNLVSEYNSIATQCAQHIKNSTQVALSIQGMVRELIKEGAKASNAGLDVHDAVSKAVQDHNGSEKISQITIKDDDVVKVDTEAETERFEAIRRAI